MKKKRKTTRHHLTPKSRLKFRTLYNDMSVVEYERILKLWRDKHNAWHFLFSNLTLEEIIIVLLRIKQIKEIKQGN